MTKKILTSDPAELVYIDESKLSTQTDDEEWQDSYDMGYTPEDYPEPSRSEYAAFLKRNGYEL